MELPHANQLGEDSFGRTHIEALERENIDTSQISVTTDDLSGNNKMRGQEDFGIKKSQLDKLINFSQPLGANYTG